MARLRDLIPRRWQQKVIFAAAFVYLLAREILSILAKKLNGLLPQTGRQRFIFAVATVFLLLVAAPAIYRILSNKPVRVSGPEIITYSTDAPDETPPGPDFNWRGRANDPKKIAVPSLGIDGFIQMVGVDQNREVAVPNNIHIAGWFVDSVRPGERGLSIIDGHVNGRFSGEAVFSELARAVPGAEIIITFGDDSTKTFTVLDVTERTADKTAEVLFSQEPSVSSQLNLITCSGSFDRDSRRYDRRVIVSAALVP